MNVYHIASIALQVLYQEIIVLMLLTLLHSEQPKLHRVLAVLSAKGFKTKEFLAISYAYVLLCLKWIESKTYTISRHYPILSQTKLKGIKLRISLILPIYIYKKKKKIHYSHIYVAIQATTSHESPSQPGTDLTIFIQQ